LREKTTGTTVGCCQLRLLDTETGNVMRLQQNLTLQTDRMVCATVEGDSCGQNLATFAATKTAAALTDTVDVD